jgi:HSP20 family molecular chaperone IbpA
MTTLTRWTRRDPFAQFDSAFDSLVRSAFGSVGDRSAPFTPAAELARDGDDAVVRLELPGLDVSKDVTVEVDRGRLVIRGERRDERTEDRDDGYRLREVRYGSFHRSFALPAHVTADAVSAGYDAGVLTVRVAGAWTGAEARRIAVATTPAVQSGEQPAVPAGEQPAVPAGEQPAVPTGDRAAGLAADESGPTA